MKRHSHAPQVTHLRWGALLSALMAAALLLVASSGQSVPRGQVTQLAPTLLSTTPAAPVALPAARVVTLRYDATGRVISAGYGGASLHYQYDASGNLMTQTYQSSIYLPVITRESN